MRGRAHCQNSPPLPNQGLLDPRPAPHRRRKMAITTLCHPALASRELRAPCRDGLSIPGIRTGTAQCSITISRH